MRKMTTMFLAGLMALSVATTSVPAVGVMAAEPAVMAETATPFSFGTSAVTLTEGSYDLPVSMLKADLSGASMAAATIQGATLDVDKDGNATVTVKVTSLTMYGMTVWAKDWMTYSDYENKTLAENTATTTDEEGNETSFTFAVSDPSADGVYITMNSGRASDAYLSFDYANATAITVPNDPFYFGTSKTNLPAGEYDVNVDMLKADLSGASMAAAALNGAQLVVDETGKATLTVKVTCITMYGQTAWASNWRAVSDYAADPKTEVENVDTTTDEEGNQTSFTFVVPNTSADGVYLAMDMMGMTQFAYMTINYADATAVQEPEPEPVVVTTEKKTQTIKGSKTITKTYKVSTLKKSKKTIKLGQSAKTTLSYKVYAKDKKKVLSLSNGKVYVKKKAKKGTYTIKVRVTAKSTTKYNSAKKIVTVKVKVK